MIYLPGLLLLSCSGFVALSATAIQQQQIPFLAVPETDSTLHITPPSSPLPFSDLNILSTTDTHGWVRGHPREPSYSASLADFISFSSHLRNISSGDFLIVDSGDTLDGNGFVDADISGVKGKRARELLKEVGYDVVTMGNHELYNYTVALDVWRNYRPHFEGRYLASNVDILVPASEVSEASEASGASEADGASEAIEADGASEGSEAGQAIKPGQTNQDSELESTRSLIEARSPFSTLEPEPASAADERTWTPFGSRSAHFTLPKSGKKVTSFGILFNFDRPDPRGLRVTPPSVMVGQTWWKKALKEETDVFVIGGCCRRTCLMRERS